MKPLRWTATAALLVACLACRAAPADGIAPGRWRAWLESPGGELPFGLELERTADESGWQAFLLNEPERIEVDRAVVDGRKLVLDVGHFGSRVDAELDASGRLTGRWRRTSERGSVSELAFHAERGSSHRFTPLAGGGDGAAVAGRWRVRFEGEEDEGVGEFAAAGGARVTGTFLMTTGDYRYLAGSFEAGRLRLSAFDGAHAFLFDARLEDDGTLRGDFWSRDTWHDTWTAVRDDEATLPDATAQIGWTGLPLSSLVYPDLDGTARALDDPAFAGRARLIEVFGTWCPNCNDETRYLLELHERYASRGLSILALAFEMSGDFERDAAQVRRYVDYHGIEYPILIAGTSDKGEASQAFPLLDRVKAFPTTIFLDADGNVSAVWSGFSGPATGVEHERLRERWEARIEELLGDGS